MASRSRDRDKERKYLSGNQERALANAKVARNKKHEGAIEQFLATPSLKRPWIGDEENKNDLGNADRTMNPSTVDQYNDDVNKKLEKITQLLIKWKTILIHQNTAQRRKFNHCWKKTSQKLCSFISSTSTDVIAMNDDPANWPVDINKNVRDYLTIKCPPNITCNIFPKNRKRLCFKVLL